MKKDHIFNFERIKIILWNIAKFMRLGPLALFIHPKSALVKLGWFKSFHKKNVMDKMGNPIPWWTYSVIDFIEERLNDKMRVLEYGCGGSTIWFSKKVREVISFDDEQSWVTKISKEIDGLSKVTYVKNIADYDSYKHLITGTFDILIIDNSGDRVKCVLNDLQYLKNEGVIIWDNTDGPDWGKIKTLMLSRGYREISFTGMIPQELSYSKTTIFYKPENCLNI